MIAETHPPVEDKSKPSETVSESSDSARQRRPFEEMAAYLRMDAKQESLIYVLRSNTNHDGE